MKESLALFTHLKYESQDLLFRRLYCLLLAGYLFVRTGYAWEYFSAGLLEHLFLSDYIFQEFTDFFVYQVLRWSLIGSVIAVALGFRPRLFSALALFQYINFFFLLSQDLKPHDDNLVVFLLLAFAFIPNYSTLIAKAGLSAVYLASAASKLMYSGLSWFEGLNLRLNLAQKYLDSGNLLARELLENPWACSFIASGTLVFEASFWVLLLVRKLAPIYAVIGVIFHLGVYFVMDINFLRTFLLAYLAFLPLRCQVPNPGRNAARIGNLAP